MATVESLGRILRNILEKELTQKTGLLTKEHCEALLRLEENVSPLMKEKQTYPCSPLYFEISRKLIQWMENGEFPVKNEACGLLAEQDAIQGRKEISQNISPLLIDLKTSWSELSADEKTNQLTSVLRILGVRGLLDLLNVRRTQGSVDVFPPPLRTLVMSFNKKHTQNAGLTVGARALSKHCHRDVTSEWWGPCTGSEQAKNENANMILMRILDDASWINIHMLPHDLKVLEVRCSEGYGARWSHDGEEFRGFLEPQMADGHAIGWRH